MKIKYLSILIGCVATLNISAQDISKPVIKKTEVQTPKRTTTTESKKRAASRVVPQRKRNSSYSSSFLTLANRSYRRKKCMKRVMKAIKREITLKL